jgi:hypothetical protein
MNGARYLMRRRASAHTGAMLSRAKHTLDRSHRCAHGGARCLELALGVEGALAEEALPRVGVLVVLDAALVGVDLHGIVDPAHDCPRRTRAARPGRASGELLTTTHPVQSRQ